MLRSLQVHDEAFKEIEYADYMGAEEDAENIMWDCIMSTLAVFCEECCKLGDKNIWSAARVDSEAKQFITQLVSKVWFERGFGPYDKRLDLPFQSDPGSGRNFVRQEELRRIYRRPEWKAYERRRLAVAEVQAKASEASERSRPKRGYRSEVKAWMRHNSIQNQKIAAKRLGVGVDTLKSIMSSVGETRYSAETLDMVLAKIGKKSDDK